jgi:hypothetical protein
MTAARGKTIAHRRKMISQHRKELSPLRKNEWLRSSSLDDFHARLSREVA